MELTPTLYDSKVRISKLEPEDFEQLYLVASDKELWSGHPSKDRYKRAVFEKWFESALNAKTALKIVDRLSHKIIGSTRFYDYIPSKEVAIGFTFLSRDYWGGQTNSRVKRLMMNYALKDVECVLFHIAPSNIRSQKAIEKLGAIFSHIEVRRLSSGEEEYFCFKYND